MSCTKFIKLPLSEFSSTIESQSFNFKATLFFNKSLEILESKKNLWLLSEKLHSRFSTEIINEE